MRVAHNEHRRVEEGLLIDEHGHPTTDPGVVVVPQSNGLFGALMPFGEHKGFGMAVACELLGGALTGTGTWHRPADTRRTVINGMFAIVVDPERLGTRTPFETEALAFVDWLRQSPPAPGTLAAIARWREAHARMPITLVRGNHDDRAGDPPAALNIDVVDEPLREGPFALCHHPRPVADAYVIAGHWHPCISVSARAFERLRLPCFWFGDDTGALPQNAVAILPAFGSFTGMHRIEPRAGDRIFPVAENIVRALPPLPIA
jgi:hypothetical protein